MIVDELSRRDLLVGGTALAALLAGCAAPASGGAGGATRRVADPSGRVVDIPADPQRIVALDPNRVITDLVAVGLVPVAATTNPSNPDGGFARVLGPQIDGMVSVGGTGEADLETVTAQRPDLIFHAVAYQEIDHATLSAIAPVVSYDAAPPGLLEPLRWIGGITGRPAEAAAVEARFTALLDERRAALGLAGRRVATINLANYELTPTLGLMGPRSGVGELMTLLGGTVVPTEVAGTPVEPDHTDIALELVPGALAGADLVVAVRYTGSATNDARFAQRLDDPLWRAVPAVARGDVAYVDIQQANGNTGLAGVAVALDELAAQLA